MAETKKRGTMPSVLVLIIGMETHHNFFDLETQLRKLQMHLLTKFTQGLDSIGWETCGLI